MAARERSTVRYNFTCKLTVRYAACSGLVPCPSHSSLLCAGAGKLSSIWGQVQPQTEGAVFCDSWRTKGTCSHVVTTTLLHSHLYQFTVNRLQSTNAGRAAMMPSLRSACTRTRMRWRTTTAASGYGPRDPRTHGWPSQGPKESFE